MLRPALFAALFTTSALISTPVAFAQNGPDECEVLIYGPSGAPKHDASVPITPVPPGTQAPGGTTPGGTPGVPGTTPTPNPKPTTPPGSSSGGSGSSSGGGTKPNSGYVTKPSTAGARVVSKKMASGATVTYYIGRYTSGYKPQNLTEVKSYPAPSGGIVRTVGGQKILVASSRVTTSGLSSRMVNIIDELNITAKLLGLPSPVITSATDGAHSAGSVHGSGNGLDLRCRERTICTQWAMVLKQALGPGYDVMFEDWGGANNHLHLEFDGKTP